MSNPDDFASLRRYTRNEVAATLNIPEPWLKVWVTDDLVPHQRSGKPGPRQRGVWFTRDDILEVGRKLPALMSARQANGRAEAAVPGVEAPEPEQVLSPVSDADLERFAGLSSLRA